jgi:hypothetical protein
MLLNGAHICMIVPGNDEPPKGVNEWYESGRDERNSGIFN